MDIINSRETEKVAEWLKTYPNIQVISRDGASTYANASSLSHPEVCQISDRFHLFKNLSEAFSRFLMRQFPSRIEIPADKESARERQYRNSVKQKQKEIEEVRRLYQNGFSIQEIRRMTGHISATVKKYLNPTCTGENVLW